MTLQPSFRRALLSLSHPLSIGAIVLLLINDHVWRKVAPSWFTGKIGDVAWLVFAPFLLAALLAWLWPKREDLVGRWSIIGTGLIFALAKTLPEVHSLTIRLLGAVVGAPIGLRRDPSDLITLPALLISAWIWRQSAFGVSTRRGWLMLTLGAFATMANVGPSTDIGVRCLVDMGSQVAAIVWRSDNVLEVYLSADGGLTWQLGQPNDATCSDPYRPSRRPDPQSPLIVNDPANPAIQYRVRAGVSVERSADGGQTWQIDFNLGGEEARIRALDDVFYLPVGPFDALVHAATGQVVVAMGKEGLLVRATSGAWQWVSIGPYAVAELTSLDRIMALLSGELRLALIIGVWLFVTVIRDRRGAKWSGFFVVLAWGVILLLSLILKPNDQGWRTYLIGVVLPATYITGAIGVVMAIWQVRIAWPVRRRAVGIAALIAVAGAIGFALPFVLWTQGVIAFYGVAWAVALMWSIIFVLAGRRLVWNQRGVSTPSASSLGR